MQKRQYHYLVAGLADLAFDSSKNYLEMNEFKDELKTALHPSDYLLISILFLPHDNNNLITYLEGNIGTWDPLGNYTFQDFEDQKWDIHSLQKADRILPDYMVEVMADWFDSDKKPEIDEIKRKITEGYIDMALSSGNSFLENWVSFDRDVNNIFTLINSKRLNLDAENYIIGNDPFAKELKEIFEKGKDFVIPSDPEYAQGIFKTATENEFLEREKKIDLTRWEFIDSATFFEYFTVDLIMGFLIKLSIVLRWKQLDTETGRIMLQKLVKDMEKQVLTGNFSNKQ